MSEWQQWKISLTGSSTSSTSFSTSIWETNPSTIFRGNQRGGAIVIWVRPRENWPPGILETLSINNRQGEPLSKGVQDP